MKDKEKAQTRFEQKAEEMEITFVPQCCRCNNNISLETCKQFSKKPHMYMTNEIVCPLWNKDTPAI